MPLTETQWSKKICERLKKVQNLVLHRLVGNLRQDSGLPDTIIIHKGRTIFIEWKGEKTEVKKHQSRELQNIRAAGGIVFIVRWPNIICNADETVLKYFDETPFDLLKCLHMIIDGDSKQNYT